MKLLLCLLMVMLSCSPVEPDVVRVPEHFRLLGEDLRVEVGRVSGLLGLYEVSWRGERLLPLGYSFWSGEVNAVNGPGVALLMEMFPPGSMPRDLNCDIIIKKLAQLDQRWLIEPAWLEDALFAGNLQGLTSYLPRAHTLIAHFGTDSWISSDPLDEHLYSGTTRLKMYPGETRIYIGLHTEQVKTLHLLNSGRLVVLDRAPRQ